MTRRLGAIVRVSVRACTRRLHVGVVSAVLVVLGGCAAQTDGPAVPRMESVPGATAHAVYPSLASQGDSLVVLWTERGDSSRAHRLVYAVRHGGRWSAPDTVATGRDWFVNGADFPAVALLSGGRMVAHWLVKSAPGTYTYDVHLAWYDPATRRWSTPTRLNTDGVAAEHGFVSYAPLPSGEVWIVWLDGRHTTAVGGHGHESEGEGAGGAMTLRAARFDALGRRLEEHELDGRVCDCCQTAAVTSPNGDVTVVYRDRSEAEVRDVGIVRLRQGRWQAPERLHADEWTIDGCPVNGPALAQHGPHIAAAWFTAAQEMPTARLMLSSDAGASFSAPRTLGTGEVRGRMHVLARPDGPRASWIEARGDTALLFIGRGRWNGAWEGQHTVDSLGAGRTTGVPRMAAVGDSLAVAWTSARGIELWLVRDGQ